MSDNRMSAEEIRRMYKEAKDKPRQITILAEINLCKRSDIKRIIDEETDELPPVSKKMQYQHQKREEPDKIRCSNPATPLEVKLDIIRLHLNGNLGKDIAKATGVSQATVSKVIGEYKDGKLKFTEDELQADIQTNTEEEKDVIFAEDLDPVERDQLTEEVEQATIPKEVECDSTFDSIPDGNIECIAGGLLESVAELSAKGYTVSVEPVNDKGVITVTVEDSNNYACLKRRMSSNDKS